MAKMSKEDLARAAKVQEANDKAAAQIEQAGRGLAAVIGQCRTNTTDLSTVSDLLAISAYVNDAAMILMEKERGAGAPAERRLLVPRP